MTASALVIRRLFPYYGAKHAYSASYPAPRHGLIVEPFAGSAAYAHRWGENNEVILIEKNPRIAAIWRWILEVSEDEFLSLPGVDTFDHIDQTGLPDGPAREYVRQWCADASPNGQNKVTSMTSAAVGRKYVFDTKHKPEIMASIKKIRHWQIIAGGYDTAPDVRATWYIDPPYQFGGEHYPKNCKTRDLDFDSLATWAKARRGDVIVCEGNGADWMDFDVLRSCKDNTDKGQGFGQSQRQELIWYSRDGAKVEGWNVASYAQPDQGVLF